MSDSVVLAGGLSATKDEDYPRLAGSTIALAGVALGIIGLWLPLWDPESLRRALLHLDEIEAGHSNMLFDNRLLVESLPASLFVVIAVWCAVSVVLVHRKRRTPRPMPISAGRTRRPVMAAIATAFRALVRWTPTVVGVATILLALVTGLAADLMTPTQFVMETGSVGPGLGVKVELVAGLLMLIGGLLVVGSSWFKTLAVASAAGVLVAGSMWTFTALDEPLSPHAGMHVSGAPGDTPANYSEYVATFCKDLGIERTAARFGVASTAEEAARAVAGQQARPWWDAAYEGCLRGLRSQ